MSTELGLAAQLELAFYPIPTAGFRARMGVLFALNAVTIVLAIIHLTILWIDSKRKGRKFWFFRLVTRPSGDYIATNQSAIISCFAIISVATILGHVQDEANIYLYKGSQAQIAAWRAFGWIPVFLLGWFISWAGLQSFLLTPDQHSNHLLSARMANGLFVGGGIAITVALFVGAGFSAAAGNEVWYGYVNLQEKLAGLSAGGTNIDLAGLSTAYDELLALAANYRTKTIALGVILAATPFMTAVINLGSLGLTRVLRRQIQISLRQMRGSQADHSPALTSKTDQSEGITSMSPLNVDRKWNRSSNGNGGRGGYGENLPSKAEIRQIASTGGTSGFESEQAKKIMLLQRAESDLTIIGSLIFGLSVTFAIIAIWIEVRTFTNNLSGLTASWGTIETALFLTQWIYSLVLNIAIAFLIYNAHNNITARTQAVNSSDVVQVNYAGGSMSMASFGAMFRRGEAETVDLGPNGYSSNSPGEGGEEVLKTPTFGNGGGGGGGAFPTTGRKNSFPGSSPFPTTPKRQATFPPPNRAGALQFGNAAPVRAGAVDAGVRMNTLQEEEDRSQMNRLA